VYAHTPADSQHSDSGSKVPDLGLPMIVPCRDTADTMRSP